ncbi:MAG: MurT ligase domain-containing protein [Candidatus Heteroscillospira sp.]|jgi:UDP-N-acetylmuramyl tripeptide synthase
MKIIAIFVCKLIRLALRVIGRGGTALPGKIALRLCPNLLGHLTKDVKTIVITGTNGKTTTSRIVEQAFINSGKSYFANKSGANLITGITAEFAAHATLTGKPKCEYAVIECDEAASKAVLRYLKPSVVLVTNVFRDQLDRYGEVTHTLDNIRIGLENVPEAVLCLNADCSLTSSLSEILPNRCIFYGVDTPIYRSRVAEVSDAPYCIHCKSEYEYDYVTYGHLGGYRCTSCGYRRPKPDVSVTRIMQQTADWTDIELSDHGEKLSVRLNLPGGFNIYNAVGAYAALSCMGFSTPEALHALNSFECGFGRMERFDIDGATLRMILIKNPAGCNQVLNFLTNLDGQSVFTVCLNDNYADGTDISWIWDVNFEVLLNMGSNLTRVLVSGVRADDMALRLYYAGIPKEKILVIHDYDKLIDTMLASDKPVFIMPTYTAMLDLRGRLSARFGFKNFWE